MPRQRADAPPFSRPVAVATLPPGGTELVIEPDDGERSALAAAFGLDSVRELRAEFRLTPASRGRVQVEGRVVADVVPICVVTLEPFEQRHEESFALTFSETPQEGEGEDQPDPIVDGSIDLGAVTAEFLALALDPYPRKPGASFSYSGNDEAAALSPFAVLKARQRGEE